MKNLLDFSFPDSSWSRYQLDREAYLVFLALQQQPTMPVSQLADRLQFSTTLVNSRLAYLKNQGFLRPDREILVPFLGRRLQTEVEAIYDYHSLGLIRYHVFFEDMDSFQQVQYLEQFLAIHPFTHYHVVTYSPSLTIYVQFDIPSQASSFVDKLCHILQEMGIIGSFHSFNETVVATSETDFSKWRVRTNTWELLDSQGFNPKSLVSDLDILWDEFLNNQDSFATPVTTMSSWSFNFDDIDMQLLRELTVNGKPVVTDLAKHYKISRSRLSRRLSRLKENVIRGNRLVYDPLVFELNYPQIIEGTFKTTDPFSFNTFYHFIQSDMIPFASSVVLTKDKFLWYMRVPASLVAIISRFTLEHAKNVKIHQIDPATGQTYYFNHRNLKNAGVWISDENYIIDQPLEIAEIGNVPV